MYSLTDIKTIDYLCKKYDFKFKHGLGQNFLTEEDVLFAIADAAEIDGCGVLEVGPGFGCLTAVLASRAKKVLSLEVDKKLAPVLSETLAAFDNIDIVFEDVLKSDLNNLIENNFSNQKISVAANLPYYITTPVIMRLLQLKLPLKNIVVMVQKEVAERMCSSPGGKEYGAVTLAVNYYAQPSIICEVNRKLFVPSPNVDSAVLKLAVREAPPVCIKDEEKFFALIKAAFAQRRKTLLNALKNSGRFGSGDKITNAIASLGLDSKIRGERLSIEEFAKLSDLL